MSNRSTILATVRSNRLATIGAAQASYQPNISYSQTLEDGTGDDQAEETVTLDKTITQASSTTFDLTSAGAGDEDITGLEGDVTFTAIKAMYIENEGAQDLTVGDAAATPFNAWVGGVASAVIVIPAGGMALLTAPEDGWTVDATHRLLKFAAAAGADDVDITVILVGLVS